jgi:hypothetical protein
MTDSADQELKRYSPQFIEWANRLQSFGLWQSDDPVSHAILLLASAQNYLVAIEAGDASGGADILKEIRAETLADLIRDLLFQTGQERSNA